MLYLPAGQQRMCGTAAGEMLHAAEPFLERHLHPTVIIRGFVKALEDALAVVDELAFPIDIHDREQMLKIIASCIGTKFTSRFGTLMPVSNICLHCRHVTEACQVLRGLSKGLSTSTGSVHATADRVLQCNCASVELEL